MKMTLRNFSRYKTVGFLVAAILACGLFAGVDPCEKAYGDTSPQPIYNTDFSRISGDTALDTMKGIVLSPLAFGEQRGGTVVLATMGGYWDALSASAVAGHYGAPVVLTDGADFSVQAAEAIATLQPAEIVVMGGVSAISDEVVEAALRSAAPSATWQRISGDDAADTSVKASLHIMGYADWESVPPSNTAFIATSASFQDALSIAPYCYKTQSPVFLTEPDGSIGEDVLVELSKYERVYIVGGFDAVPGGEIYSSVPSYSPSISNYAGRIFGATAVDTSAAVATWCVSEGMSVPDVSAGRLIPDAPISAPSFSGHSMGLATVNDWHDALAGAAYCAHNNIALVLTAPGQTQPMEGFVHAYGYRSGGVIFGGESALPSSVLGNLPGYGTAQS